MRGTKRKRREGVWEVRVYLGRDPVTGQPKQLSRTVHGGAREADDVLRELIAKHSGASSDQMALGLPSVNCSTDGSMNASASIGRRPLCGPTGPRLS